MKSYAFLFILLFGLLGCEPVRYKDMISGDFAHTVLVWLKNPDSQEDRAKLEAGLKQLIEDSQYIRSVHLGKPALTARDIVDNSYDYCLIITFGSKEKQDKYQDEPAHKKFMEECNGIWGKIIIYDSMSILDSANE